MANQNLNQLCESHILQEQARSIQQQNVVQRQQMYIQFPNRQQKKQQQVLEMTQLFQATAIQEKIYQNLRQECYLIQLLPPHISLKLILDHDFPKSPPRLFATSCLYHDIIDPNTWQINHQSNSSLKDLLCELKQIFTIQPPEQDPYLKELSKVRNKVNEDQLLQKLQSVDIRVLFYGALPQEYKGIVEGPKLNEYIFKLPEYKQLAEYIIELATCNENFSNHLIEQNQKILNQKKELQDLAAYYETLKQQTNSKYMECEAIRKQFDKGNLVKLIDQQLNQLDELSTEKVESMEGSIEENLAQYLELRKRYHRLQMKREKLEQSK